jgi:hypothetical protein
MLLSLPLLLLMSLTVMLMLSLSLLLSLPLPHIYFYRVLPQTWPMCTSLRAILEPKLLHKFSYGPML